MSIRLEDTTDGHSKFWCILLKGSETTVTYGKIGTKGRSLSKKHGSEEKAKKFHDTQIEKKKKEGYVEADHPEGDHPSDCSSDECHEPAAKKPKTSKVFKDKGVTVVGTEFEHGLTMALAKAAAKAGGGKWLPPSEYEMAEVVVGLDDAEDDDIQNCHATDEIKLMTEKEFMDLVGLEATPAVKKPKVDEPLGKSKGGHWDGTLKTGVKVFWIGGFDWDLSNKYFGVNNCGTSVYGMVNSKLKGKMTEVETNWSHPERVPKKKELKEMEHADFVVKGSWFTKSVSDEKVKTMAAHSLEVAEKMGCTIVDEESVYIAIKKIQDGEPKPKLEGVSKAKGGNWDGTLKKGIKVFWMGGFNMPLSEKYFGVPNQTGVVMDKINVELKGEFLGVATNWKHPEQVPTDKELMGMENADIVVKGAWFTPGDVNSKAAEIKKMAANCLEAAEKRGCVLVGEEAFYIAMVGKKD